MSEFDRLWSESLPGLKTLACARVFNADDREDLIQEARIKAWSKFHTYEPGQSFRNWILRIFLNSYIDYLRSRSRRMQTISLDAAMELHPELGAASHEDVSKRIHDRAEIESLYACLPPHIREIVMARAAGWSMAEISRATGINPKTLATWRFRAAQNLEVV